MYTVKRVKAIAAILANRYVNKNDGRLMIYPCWLRHYHLELLESHNLAKHKTYGPNTYAHTDYFITQ